MNKVERIKHEMKAEAVRHDMALSHIEFNRRELEVVMTYVYEAGTHDDKDPHMAAHNRDPELLTLEEAVELIHFSRDQQIAVNERNDEFI